ncbi:hypothetical protein [Aeromonas veronii]|uniref:hypothetical protein n=1 Tax=Aeromonas veronii TaxID=654 RepID=UPI00208E4A29|nr:hypothetical protein [Aeromonas veronii]USP60155.1 hypothetical protein J6598_09780 [Aeromonas veronii]
MSFWWVTIFLLWFVYDFFKARQNKKERKFIFDYERKICNASREFDFLSYRTVEEAKNGYLSLLHELAGDRRYTESVQEKIKEHEFVLDLNIEKYKQVSNAYIILLNGFDGELISDYEGFEKLKNILEMVDVNEDRYIFTFASSLQHYILDGMHEVEDRIFERESYKSETRLPNLFSNLVRLYKKEFDKISLITVD